MVSDIGIFAVTKRDPAELTLSPGLEKRKKKKKKKIPRATLK